MSEIVNTLIRKLPAWLGHCCRVCWLTMLVLLIIHLASTQGTPFIYWDQ
jgi:hypothetical protein